MNPVSRIRHKFQLHVPVLAALLVNLSGAFAQSAAETDWIKHDRAGQCRGHYVEPAATKSESRPGTVEASADSILHVTDHSTTLTGNIRLSQDGQELTADFATVDDATEHYTAEGNVTYRQNGLLMRGEHIEGNLFSGMAAIDSASFLVHQNRLRGTAGSISRDDAGKLVITDGKFTTCEPDDQTWAITGKEIELKTAEGYGVARDVTLQLRNIPVVWLPYFRFPIDDRRQSGLLVPGIGRDSDGGTDIAIPYYFNLAPNYDATYTLRSMWKRGVMHEGEFRYLNRLSMNTIAGTFLPSDEAYDERERIDLGRPDAISEQDRWLFHLAHRGSYGRWQSALNYTRVSDIDYFRDLGNFTRTDSSFSTRTDQGSSPALLSTGALTYRGNGWRSSLELRSFQELNQVHQKQYEVLPRLNVSTSRQFGNLATAVAAQYARFDKSENSAVTGNRAVLDGQLSFPVQRPWGYLTPALRFIHRDYSLENAGGRDSSSLSTVLASLDAGLVFERTTHRFDRRLLQTLEPRMQYLYVEEDFQEDLPLFDSTLITPSFASLYRDNRFTGYDRIGDANRFSLGATSRFINPATGKVLLAVSLGQMFHFEDRRVEPFGIPGIDGAADTSPLFAELETTLGRLMMRAAIEYDTDTGRSNRGLIALRYRGSGDEVFNFTYRMSHPDLQRDARQRSREETDLSIQWPLGDRWQLVGRWNYGWQPGQTIESLVGVEYNDCCWKARIVFRRNLDEPRLLALDAPGMQTRLMLDRRADSGIFFEFQLKGLASLGGRLDSLLEDSIPGYITDR